MKGLYVEVSEEAIVFCGKLPCDCWLYEEKACENCPIVTLRKLKPRS